jgi:hypothetical protein
LEPRQLRGLVVADPLPEALDRGSASCDAEGWVDLGGEDRDAAGGEVRDVVDGRLPSSDPRPR